jgi:hypothetical protein
MPTWSEATMHSSLALLCPPQELQLDPRIDQRIISLLSDRNTKGFPEVFITFDEHDAASIAAGKENEFFGISGNQKERLSNPLLARAYLDIIKESLDHDSFEAGVEDDLLTSLWLPNCFSEATPFPLLHSSTSVPANIPGVRLPPLLHPLLTSHPVFRRRTWRRPSFTMAKFLADNQLEDCDAHTRRQFWEWLRVNEAQIKPKETTQLVHMTIWPDENYELCTLTQLCEPKNRNITEILKPSIHVPHDHVRRSRLAVVGKKRQGRIRRVPTASELANWLDDRIASFPTNERADNDVATKMERLESNLALLLKDPSIAPVVKAINRAIPGLAEDGFVRWRSDMILPDTSIRRLELPARFLLRRSRFVANVQKVAPALSEPTTSMLRSAFQEDGTNFAALQARLSRFLNLTEPGDVDREAVKDLPIIPVNNQAWPPSDLAFTGPKGDYWRSWKTRLSTKGLSQDDQRRYLDIGVTSATPTVETSQAFFEWLSRQDAHILELHIPSVLRHILHHNGPEGWGPVFSDIPFIPTKNAAGIRLVALRSAQRGRVYVDDLPPLAQQILNNDPRISFVIDKVKEVTEPIIDVIRRLDVRSLRESVGEPEIVNGIGDRQEGSTRIVSLLNDLRSHRIRTTLQKRLSQLGVESELVRHDWFNRVAGIRGVKFATQVEATFRFHGRRYSWTVDAGFDHQSGIFWIGKHSQDTLSSFCESLAEHLILKTTARPVDRLALQRALQMEISDPTFGHLDSTAPQDTKDLFDQEFEVSSNGDEGEPGESLFGHSPFDPDPAKNLPKPTQFESTPRVVLRETRTVWRETKTAPALEQEHIELLKTTHYASHCQMCLCERSPSELAPTGSYVEWQEVRRRIIEAHHLDPKGGGGVRHAGNLILLCKLHHDNYGRRLTRETLTTALRKRAKKRNISFGAESVNRQDLIGRVLKVLIPDSGEVVEIFFTNEHAEYWLSRTTTSR